MDPLGRVPVTIVTGFLGSGKTTLLNNLLSGSRLGRVAALVNDFGAIDIDAALISSVAQEVVQLANGCICCTINGDLLAAVKKVLALEQPVDRIVVETTGLADPLPVGLTFLQTELREKCNLEAVVTVVDAANFALDLFDANAAMAQIVYADIIVLNKADLVDAAQLDTLQSRIAVIKPRVRIVSAAYAKVPLSLIVDPASSQVSLLNFPTPHQHHHSHLLDDGFSACAFRFDNAISGVALQSWLDSGLPAAVFRAKGILHFDRPDARYVFQFCGGRSSFERYDGPINDTRIVFIGQKIDESALEARFRSCLVEKRAGVACATV